MSRGRGAVVPASDAGSTRSQRPNPRERMSTLRDAGSGAKDNGHNPSTEASALQQCSQGHSPRQYSGDCRVSISGPSSPSSDMGEVDDCTASLPNEWGKWFVRLVPFLGTPIRSPFKSFPSRTVSFYVSMSTARSTLGFVGIMVCNGCLFCFVCFVCVCFADLVRDHPHLPPLRAPFFLFPCLCQSMSAPGLLFVCV